MQTPQEIIEKLRKLLRLATDKAATQGEAEAAMQKAQELALRYKIELAGIEHADRPAEEYTEERQVRRKTFQAKYVALIVMYEGKREKRPVPDFALDRHTARGRAAKRARRHFWEQGAKLENPAPLNDPYEAPAREIRRDLQGEFDL